MNRREFMAMAGGLVASFALPAGSKIIDGILVNEVGEKILWKNEIVVGLDDINNVRDFWTIFNVDMGDRLAKALVSFENNLNLENQHEFAMALMEELVNNEHEAFSDSLWVLPKEYAAEKLKEFDK